MKLLINTSNLSVGGGMQVAISFINELKNFNLNNSYYIFLSKEIEKQIEKELFNSNFSFYTIEHSPSSLKYRKAIVKYLYKLESEIQPDIVYSIFGPTFWTPKSIHVMGFALPWLINPSSSAFTQLPLLKRIKKKVEIIYKSYYVRKNADYYIAETEDTKIRLAKYHYISLENIFVVGNTYNSYFNIPIDVKSSLLDTSDSEYRLITVSHNYPHKNLKIIKEVIDYLKDSNLKFKFVLTIDIDSFNLMFGDLRDYVMTIEPIDTDLCPLAYHECNALFLPTLLECFTASYPEAMKMEKPILTSDLSFSKSICQDAAIYFDPLNPKDIAGKIIKLAQSKDLEKTLIEKGKKRLKTFETAKSRAEKYLDICETIIKKENKNEAINTKL